MSDILGWFVLAGHRLPITKVELRAGMVWLTAVKPGPVPAGSGWITVAGHDGRGVFQCDEVLHWDTVRERASLTVVLPVRVTLLDNPVAKELQL